jgi:hypothetical protein
MGGVFRGDLFRETAVSMLRLIVAVTALALGAQAWAQLSCGYELTTRRPNYKEPITGERVNLKEQISGRLPEVDVELSARRPLYREPLTGTKTDVTVITGFRPNLRESISGTLPEVPIDLSTRRPNLKESISATRVNFREKLSYQWECGR